MTKIKSEIIKRFWRLVYSNSNEPPYQTNYPAKWLSVEEQNYQWEAVKIIWRFYWITEIERI